MAPPKKRTGPGTAAVGPSGASNGAAIVAVSGATDRGQSEAVIWSRFGVDQLEIAAWLAIAVVAFGIRWINLDGNPLQSAESTLALMSWHIVHGEGVQLGPSPLLTYGNAFLFLALGATDAVARAIPALAGLFIALVPWLLREQLGRFGALVAAVVLATSPTLVFASRSVDATTLSIALGLGLVLLARRYARTRAPWTLYGLGILGALLLMSGPVADQLVVIFLVYALVHQRQSLHDWLTDDVAESTGTPAGSRPTPRLLRNFGIAFGLTLAVVATGLGTHLSGFGDALAAPLGAWAAELGRISIGSVAQLPTLLLTYEPLPLIFGLIGIVQAYRSREPFLIFLTWWAGGSAVILLLDAGSQPLWFAALVVPLALLAGHATDRLPLAFTTDEKRRQLAVFAAVVFSLVASTLIAAGNATLPDPNVPRWVAAMPLLAIVAFAVCFGLWYDRVMALRASAASGLVVLLFLQIHAAMLLNPGGPLNPAEVFTGTVTSGDVHTMVSDVSLILDELQIAQQVEGRPVTLDVAVMAPYANPIAWYLHQYPQVTVVTSVGDSPAVAIEGAQDKAPSGAYAGQLFQLSESATRPGLSPIDLGRWWLYRDVPNENETYVKVYVKTQLAQQ